MSSSCLSALFLWNLFSRLSILVCFLAQKLNCCFPLFIRRYYNLNIRRMKAKFFVVFSRQALLPPKLYQREGYAIKKLTECPTYQLESFNQEQQAHQFFDERVKEIQVTKKLSGLKTLKNNLKTESGKSALKDKTDEPVVKEFRMDPNQKQQRQKELNFIIEENKIFRKSIFKSSDVSLDPALIYEGYFDGCSLGNPGKAGIGYIVNCTHSQRVMARSEYVGTRTNNQAELVAMILLLGDAYCNGIMNLNVFGDSNLVIKGMNNQYQIHNPYLAAYIQGAKSLQKKFNSITFCHINRALNFQADALSKQGASNKQLKTSQKHQFNKEFTE